MRLNTISHHSKNLSKQPYDGSNQDFDLCDGRGQCQYQNFAFLEKLPVNNATQNQIKISNKICRQNGEFMEKVTLIKFNDQLITIRDCYRFTNNSQQASTDPNLQKRVHIFKKPLHIQSKNEGRRRVTKNLPKNFIKAFLNFLESVKDEKNSDLLDCKMKLFTSRQKYNNSFIQRIVDDPDLQPYFTDFLNNHAKAWIQQSKIRDKDVHFEAIQVFKKLGLAKAEKKIQNPNQFSEYLESFQNQSQANSALSQDSNLSDKESIIANSSKNQEDEND